jgi:hypothetical protein
MVTAREFWRSTFNDFNPLGLRPEDVASFFVDRHEDDPTRSLLERLKVGLLNSMGQPQTYKALLTGHRGSGKSSELMRAGQDLVHDFFVVWFDAEQSLADTATHLEVLLGMGLAVHAAASAAGLRPADRLANDLVKSLAKFVRKYEERKGFTLKLDQLLKQVFAIALVAGASAVGGPPAALVAGAAVVGAGQVFKTFRIELNVRDDLVKTLELPANRQEVIGALNEIIEDVQDKAGKPVLIITDGLDKVSATRAQLLFAESALLTEPSCALVYAAPIEFYHRVGVEQALNLFDDCAMLPNLPVYKRPPLGDHWKLEREANEDGMQVMRKVVTKRFEARGRAVDPLVTPQALDVLVRMSGGVMRELVRSFRDAATFAQLRDTMQIDETIARDVVNQRRQSIAPQLNAEHRQALQRVLREGTLRGGQSAAVEDELLRSLHLLSYRDDRDTFWFDVHPTVLPLL